MTTIRLVLRGMQKNIKMYYLYFFALIFSVGLFFIFSTLQYDSSLEELMGNTYFSTAFQVARILLIFITIVFSLYATNIFLRRRSQELGIYQLIGLSKLWVVRVLLLENLLLGIGALIAGIFVGILLSRFFLIILLNLIEIEKIAGLGFSWQAVIQTLILFAVLTVASSLQIIIKIYRSTLLELFQAEKQHDEMNTRHGLTSGFLAVVGLGLVGYGYYLSTLIMDNVDSLLLIMLSILVLTIVGTYITFQTSISWLFYLFRQKKNGHLGIFNSLSIAPLMHRMKGHANSLTLITVLSAMTITMVSLSYSLHYSTESDTRMAMPFDFALENMGSEATALKEKLNKAEINFTHNKVEMLRFPATFVDANQNSFTLTTMLLSAEQLQQAGLDLTIPNDGEALYYYSRFSKGEAWTSSQEVVYGSDGDSISLNVSESIPENAMNYTFFGQQLVVSEQTFDRTVQIMKEGDEIEHGILDTFMLNQADQQKKASPLFMSSFDGDLFIYDYYSSYQESLQTFGLLIFISGFLGFVFLLSTGSILYFKQMTEAEQEKSHYKTLRQLGFQVHDIMKGIIRKQSFIFLIPLMIGLLHATFAIKVGSMLISSNIVIPTIIGMTAYIFVYLLFAVLTINYYGKIVKSSM